MAELPAQERIVLAIDTSHEEEADRLAALAKEAGARFVKLGLEYSTATSWRTCSELAAAHGLDWVADAKLDDIPNTVVGAVKSLKGLVHSPFGITMHTTAGPEAMHKAQEEAGVIKMLGVTVLTSLNEQTVQDIYHVPAHQQVMELARQAAAAGMQGVVSSPQEVGMIKTDETTRDLYSMIPGTRSADASTADQARITTPAEAIKNGADLLVIGRQITQAKNPAEAYQRLVEEIGGAL